MSELTQITDYSSNLDLLLEQYKKSVKLKGMIDSQNDQADDLEQALFEIRALFYIDTAEGVQLDVIGAIFRTTRNGLSDTAYRAKIKFNGSLASSGEPEIIISILYALYSATIVHYIAAHPATPAAYYLLTDANISYAQLNVISPSGVQGYKLNPLVFADGTEVEYADGNFLYTVFQ